MADELLPKGWIADELANLIQPRGEKVRPSDFPHSKFIGMDHVESQTTQIIGSVPALTMKSNAARFYEGDVLYGRLRPYLNKITQAPFDGLASAEFIVFPDTAILKNSYLKYRLNAVDFVNFASHLNEGDRPRVSFEQIGTFQILVPPIAEQQRIVDKIEELFSDLDSGINSLKTAQQQLKVYRQSVLKWAFEGKLTAQWREEQQRQGKLASADTLRAQIKAEREQRYQKELEAWQSEVEAWEAIGKEGKKPRKPRKFNEPKLAVEDLEELPDLPKGWQWVFPEDICSPEDYSLAIGPFGSNLKVKDYRDNGKPLVFVRHITSGDFDLNPKYVSEEKFEELKPHAIQSLDLLVTKMGDPPGDCEIYPRGRKDAIITADCLKFRVWSDYVNRKFYKYCINSNLIKKQLGLITQGVAQKKISLERFKSLKFPLPTTTEQEKIVEEIESRLSICDQLEADIEANLKKAEALRQSILKQAFAGKLVPQDPNDEPAAVLLERIRTERQIKQPGKQTKTKPSKLNDQVQLHLLNE